MTEPESSLNAAVPVGLAGRAAVLVPVPAPPASTGYLRTRYTPYKSAVLRQGSRGAAVTTLQRGLRLAADGAFGPKTRAALVAFQRQQRLAATGVTSRTVWDRLEKRDYPLIALRRVTLRQGNRGTSVAVMQRAVRVVPDGVFGLRTTAAVKAVQRSARIVQNGVVSGWTWVAIENRMPR